MVWHQPITQTLTKSSSSSSSCTNPTNKQTHTPTHIHTHTDNPTQAGERPFFAALQRVQEIRLGCSQLVGSKHQTAGLEMLEVRGRETET
jgi:hypothetical protein